MHHSTTTNSLGYVSDNTQLFSYHIDNLARVLVFIGIFFIPFSTSLDNLITLGAFVSLLGGQLRNRLTMIFKYRMNYAAIALLMTLAISLFYTSGPEHYAVKQLWKYSHKILALFLLLPLFTERKWRHATFIVLVLSAISAITLCYLQYFGLLDIPALFNRPIGVLISPIPFSALVAFVYFLFFHNILDNRRLRVLNIIGLAYCFAWLLFINIERTGLLVVFALTALFFHQRFSLKQTFLICLPVLLMTALSIYVVSPTVNNRVKLIFHDIKEYQQGNDMSSSGLRLSFAKGSLQLIKQHPVLGTGVGSFPVMYDTTGYSTLVAGQSLGDPHNSYLHLGVQTGLIGLLIFLAWLALQWRDSAELPMLEKRIAQGVIVAFVVSCCFVDAFLLNQSSMPYITLIGVLYAAKFDKSPEPMKGHP